MLQKIPFIEVFSIRNGIILIKLLLIPFLKDYIALTDRLKDPTRLHRLTAYATKDPVY